MSSDSEISGASPLLSPTLSRANPARGTIARKCREFYLRRLERTSNMQKRWSLCEPEVTTDTPNVDIYSENNLNDQNDEKTVDNEHLDNEHPLRKCRSSLDLAMDSLRREISSLIAQDNDLFRQLLSLHDSIAELRERQRSCYSLYDDDDEDEKNLDGHSHVDDGEDSPSLESLSDNGDLPETSPESTLSCRSSSLSSDSVHYHHHHHHHHPRHIPANSRNRHRQDVCKKRHRASTVDSDEPRPLIFVDKTADICFRCRKVAPPYRRTRSITNFYWCSEDLESYDSGIHLQGSHSDSDHEIFV